MEVSEAQRLKAMEEENRRLKLLVVAEMSLHGEALQVVRCRTATSRVSTAGCAISA